MTPEEKASEISPVDALAPSMERRYKEFSNVPQIGGISEDQVVQTADNSEKAPVDEQGDIRTPEEKRISYVQFLTLCWTLVLGGWNDGTTGPLLPRIQEVYKVDYIVVSLIFVFACGGFMGGSLLNMYITPRLGFGKTLVLGSVMQVTAYCIQASAPPFPAFVFGYTIAGMSLSLQDAQANGFVANLKYNPKSKMGIVQACYGLGLFAAPLVSTQFAQQRRWSFHFLVSLGMAVINTTLQILVFRFKSLDYCLVLGGEPETDKSQFSDGSLFKQVMKSRTTQFIALFIVVHLGVGVTIGGWIVTYIINVRGGGPSSGYISAGVSGVMLGRVGLLWLNKRLGERNAVFLYSLLCIGLEIVVWWVPSLVGNAVALCFIGLFLGPMYPIAINQASRLLPGWMLTGAIGWIAGFGQTGSALVPFITGAIANKYGLKSLPPLLVVLTGIMTLMWMLVPSGNHSRSINTH
ncbi:hypothetical protein GALMADRAFT_1194926 [Galerina marginata CBS 339.88]|uniref:Major facilitator superfamily (MFS) profile domain-containing protein n=1 Tax=Galerina marginata (strain CBS 339.88) TaxID=685588 RepID=A0A067TN61_GALM3|nr:hypothetical protein GALMADRAFT_1194926 [Galerina marginata CBS 339.88]